MFARFHVRCAVFVWLLLAGTAAARAQAPDLREAGRPLWQQFTFRDYAAHHQVWAAAEDRHGLVYFGNKGCVLEYDGVEWRRLPVPGTTFIRGLAVGGDGVLYAGGVDELGYFARDPVNGEKRFVSLRERLPAAQRQFGDIWRAVAADDGVFFCANRQLMRWRDGRFHVWAFEDDTATTVHAVRGRVYVHRKGAPLQRVEGDALVPAGDGPVQRGARVVSVVPLDDERLLLCSFDRGLAVLGRDGHEEAFAPELTAWLARENVQTAARVGDLLLVTTRRAGALLLGLDGRFLRRIDMADGLRDGQVKHVLPSRGGDTWLCLNNGIVCLRLPPDRTILAREQGLDGSSVRAALRYAGRLHVATGGGVFRLEPADSAALRNARFVSVAELSGVFFSLVETPHGLVAGEQASLQLLPREGGPVQQLLRGGSIVSLLASRVTPGRLWVGTMGGLVRLDHAEPAWRLTPARAPLRFEVRSLVEEADGTLWLGTFTRGIVRVRGAAGDAPELRQFRGGADGLPAGENGFHVKQVGPTLFALGTNGSVLRWDEVAGRFVPAVLDAAAAPDAPAWHVAAVPVGEAEAALGLFADGRYGVWRPAGVFEATGPVQQIFSEVDASGPARLWLAGAECVARVDLGVARAPAPAPGLVLRFARLNGQTVWPADGRLATGAHHLMFGLATSAYAGKPEFSTRLEGAEDEWSAWSPRREREFSALPPGKYVFRARVRDGAVAGAEEIAFPFSIAAPWWASGWAAAAGVAALAGGMVLLVRWRVRALRRRGEQLEATIAARTRELEASREQLVVARDAADAANRAKSTFLAHMSHELRTPLNGILGYAQVLARDPAQPPPARERLGVIVRSGEHLLSLINDVLDLARVEAGQLQLRVNDFSPAQMARGVADIVRARCEEKGLAFHVRLAPGLPRVVRTDEQKLRQVLLNLLGNAVKFTERGSVALDVAPAPDGRLRFAVEDTGRGIPAEQLPGVFQPFVTTEAQRGAGTGLGLALSQNMIGLLGGRLHVASEVGRGTRFWCDLPLPEVGSGAPLETAARPAIVGVAGPVRRILVVDDDATNRAVLRDLLAPLGFAVEEAADGLSALRAARAQRPHAVLLDLRFPAGLDGLALARELRREPALAAAKIIAVSASVFESDRHQALAAGCDAFLAKPFKDEQLFALLEQHLGLAWVRAGGDIEPEPLPPVAAQPLPAEVRAQLLELARRGDARRLRARLAELAVEPAFAAEVRRLDELAASFQMKALRDLLSPDVQDHPDR